LWLAVVVDCGHGGGSVELWCLWVEFMGAGFHNEGGYGGF